MNKKLSMPVVIIVILAAIGITVGIMFYIADKPKSPVPTGMSGQTPGRPAQGGSMQGANQ
jgi:hypothetical protein